MKRAWLIFLAFLIALPASADSPIIWFGTHSKDLTASGMSFKDGSAATPSMSYLSAPSTGLFLHISGGIAFSRLGTRGLIVGTGLDFSSTRVPADNEGTISQHTFQTNINPAVNVTTGSARNLIQLEQNIGTDDSGFSIDSAAGLQVNLNSRNKSSWNNLGPFQINSQVGNGTDPQTGNSLTMGSISGNVQSGGTVNNYTGFAIGLNAAAGSAIGNYLGLNTNAQINAVTNYTGLHVGDNLATVANSANTIDATTNISGSTAQYHGINIGGNIASITGGYDGFHAAHNLTLTAGTQVFIDTNQVTAMTGGSSYNSFGVGPNVGTMSGAFASYRSFPNLGVAGSVTAFEDGTAVATSGTNYQGLNLHPTLAGMTGDVNGIIFQPVGATATNATGLSIDMTGIAAGGSKTAITTNGAPVQINNADFSVNSGAMHINAPTQAFVNVGNPTPVNNMNTSYVAPTSTVVASADSFGFGPVANVTLGHDSHITSGGLRVGTASLGMISLMTLDDSSDIQDVGGSFIAQVLTGGTGAGGVVTNAYGYRYVGGNFGSPSSILNARAYLADDPLGAPGTNSWGFYSKASYENYFGKSIKIGGAPNGTNDKVSNASVGLEVEGKALYPLPMSTATRNALTPLQGMLINNVTTGFLERYDGATWQALASAPGGIVPIAGGGTNSGTALVNNRVMQSSGGAIVEAAAITPAFALISDANGIPTQSTVTSGTLAFLDATSSVQTQLNGKQATGNYITATTGDVVAAGPGSVAATIQALAVTNSKIANATIDLPAKAAAGTNGQLLGTVAGSPAWTTTLTKTTAGDALQLITDDQTNQSTLLLKAGHTTTSSHMVWTDYQTTESTPQRWRTGMIGDKNFAISDTTASTNVLTAIHATGIVSFGVGVNINGANNLTVYDSGTFSTTWTFNGAGGGTSGSTTVKWVQAGSQVTLMIPTNAAATTGTGSNLLIANTAVPAALFPANNVGMPIFVRESGILQVQMGTIRLNASGVLQLFKTNGNPNWTALQANSGVDDGTANYYSMSYSLN